MQTSRTVRNQLFRIHTWLGLHLSLFFTFMFLTGTLLTVGIELESTVRPAVWTTISADERTASFADIYEGITQERPDARLWNILKEPAPWFANRSFATTAWGESVSFWTDPTTGTLVETTRSVGFRNILRDLHDTFLTTKRPIFILVSASSIILLVQIISGLITYRRFWKGFFRWPARDTGSRSRIGGFHRLTALWALPLALLIAITSFYFLLGGLGIEGTRPQPSPPSARDMALPADFGRDVINKAEQRAREALPGFDPVFMSLPGQKTDGLGFIGHQTGISAFRGLSTVTIDPVTFEVLGAFSPSDNRGLARWTELMHMLHFGTWGGAFSLILWVLLGFVLTGLSITGALIFAARTAPADGPPTSALRRIWRGVGLTRWLYLLVFLGICATAYQRYGPESYPRSAIFPANSPSPGMYLLLSQPLRRDTPLDVLLNVPATDVTQAAVQINGAGFEPVTLTPQAENSRAAFTLQPLDTVNKVTARLQKADDTEQTVTFHLGQPIW